MAASKWRPQASGRSEQAVVESKRYYKQGVAASRVAARKLLLHASGCRKQVVAASNRLHQACGGSKQAFAASKRVQ